MTLLRTRHPYVADQTLPSAPSRASLPEFATGYRGAAAAGERTVAPELRILLLTSRPGIRELLSMIPSLAIDHVPMRLGALASSQPAIVRAMAVVVDTAIDSLQAVEICRELQRQRPQLPIVTLLCCPASVTPWHLEMLAMVGVRGILDLQAAPDEIGRLLQSVVRGQTVFHLQVDSNNVAFLPWILAPERGRRAEAPRLTAGDVDLLSYLAQGLSDRQIGERLHLSPHTIKHYIERLRDSVGARNRIELASWAGRHGFYQPVRDPLEGDADSAAGRGSVAFPLDSTPFPDARHAVAVH